MDWMFSSEVDGDAFVVPQRIDLDTVDGLRYLVAGIEMLIGSWVLRLAVCFQDCSLDQSRSLRPHLSRYWCVR